MILTYNVLYKFDSKPLDAAFSTADPDNRRPEVVSDVISSVVVDQTGTDDRRNLVILGQTVREIYEPLTL